MSIHDPTLYAGRPRQDAFGRDGRCAFARVSHLPSITIPPLPHVQTPGQWKNHDTLISLDSICLCAHNCSTCLLYIILDFYIPLFKRSVLDKSLRYMAWTGIEAANITCRIWSFSLKVFVWLKANRAGAVTAANAISWFRKTAPQRGIYFG